MSSLEFVLLINWMHRNGLIGEVAWSVDVETVELGPILDDLVVRILRLLASAERVLVQIRALPDDPLVVRGRVVDVQLDALLPLDVSAVLVVVLLHLLLGDLLVELVGFLLHFLEDLHVRRFVVDLLFAHVVDVGSDLVLGQNGVVRVDCHLFLGWKHVHIASDVVVVRRQWLRELLLQLFILKNEVVAEVVLLAVQGLGGVELVVGVVHVHVGGGLVQHIHLVEVVIVVQKRGLVLRRDRGPTLVQFMPLGSIPHPFQHVGLRGFQKLVIVQVAGFCSLGELVLRAQHVVLVALVSIIIFLGLADVAAVSIFELQATFARIRRDVGDHGLV